MSEKRVPEELRRRLGEDPFAKSLGIELLSVEPGLARVAITLNESHHNFLGFIHGGVVFTLLDQAFAAASNSHNESAVAISMSVQFVNAAKPGDRLTAVARELHCSRRLGLYELTVNDESGRLICRSEGRVYRIGDPVVKAD
jgi:acyl-CoA thioesterase